MAFEEQFVSMFSTAMAGMMLLGLILGLAIDRAAVKVAHMYGKMEILWDEHKEKKRILLVHDDEREGLLEK